MIIQIIKDEESTSSMKRSKLRNYVENKLVNKKIKVSKKQAIFMEFILYGQARPTHEVYSLKQRGKKKGIMPNTWLNKEYLQSQTVL